MAETLTKSMIIDGIAASQTVDSSGEIIDIAGMDISEFEEGRGVLNYEHRGDKDEGASSNDIIGAITYAKKIFTEKDCENSRQKSYWERIKLPFIYIQAELFNDEGHDGAKAAAALIRYYHRRKLPILMRFSIEGSTLQREGNLIKVSVARRVAATIKPCNKSCYSGVLSDKDFESNKESSEESSEGLESLARHESPGKKILASFELDCNPLVSDLGGTLANSLENLKEIAGLSKAIAAGSTNAAPDTLTGGAALQAEGLASTRFLKASGLAALRDWNGKGSFRDFLKNRLPEASDSFIDHFISLVDDYHIKKAESLRKELMEAMGSKKLAPSKPIPAPTQRTTPPPTMEHHFKEGEKISVNNSEPLTVGGKIIKQVAPVSEPIFDPIKGVLHTPRGSLKFYNPATDPVESNRNKFDSLMKDPAITKFHDYATSQWARMHTALKEGRTPPEALMHAVIFSQMSPRTPVPMQELMYAHMVDLMNESGVDPRSSEFAQNPDFKQSWLDRDQPDHYPFHSREHFTGNINPAITLKNKSAATGREPGDIQAFSLQEGKWNAVSRYHEFHNALYKLLHKHGTNARAAVEDMIFHKNEAAKWNARRETSIRQGNDIGPYPHGPAIAGLAPKTARYAYALLGGGNVFIPDTHMARYLFGLDYAKDKNTIDYVKNVLWDDKNAHILGQIDNHFLQNHPAAKHMQTHPTFKHLFQGADAEQALFPAFWKTWVAIAEHERHRKMPTVAYNEVTDHRPFWEAVTPYLDTAKSEGEELPVRTAKLHHEWVEKYGEIPAQMMYYAYLVPQLMRAHETRKKLGKMENLKSNLIKQMVDTPPAVIQQIKVEAPQGAHKFRGKNVMPGEVEITAGIHRGSKFHLLGQDPASGHLFVKPKTLTDEQPISLVKLPESQNNISFRINSVPQELEDPTIVDATVHAHQEHNTGPEQLELLHGLNLNSKIHGVKSLTGMSERNAPDQTGWYQAPTGNMAFVKPGTNKAWSWNGWTDPDTHHTFNMARREAVFYNTARDFFGLGQHVPKTAVFRHPKTGEDMSVMERVNNGFHYYGEPEHDNIIKQLGDNGTLDKLNIMDTIMGQSDRHDANFMLTNEAPGLHLIDNGLIFDHNNKAEYPPDYMKFYYENNPALQEYYPNMNDTPVHPEAAQWALQLNPGQLYKHLLEQGVPETLARGSSDKLRAIQQQIWAGPVTRGHIFNVASLGAPEDGW